MKPRLLLSVEAGVWPAEEELEAIAGKAVESTLAETGLRCEADSELSLLFTDDETIAQINGEWRDTPKPTNVLSFPGADLKPGEQPGPVLGDIVLAQETIAREADLEGKSFEHHLTHLIVHGLLHNLGYDHGDDEEADLMEALERRILASLGIADPYDESAGRWTTG